MTRWSYRIEQVTITHPSTVERVMNTIGFDGWELVHLAEGRHYYTMWFRRPSEEPSKEP